MPGPVLSALHMRSQFLLPPGIQCHLRGRSRRPQTAVGDTQTQGVLGHCGPSAGRRASDPGLSPSKAPPSPQPRPTLGPVCFCNNVFIFSQGPEKPQAVSIAGDPRGFILVVYSSLESQTNVSSFGGALFACRRIECEVTFPVNSVSPVPAHGPPTLGSS